MPKLILIISTMLLASIAMAQPEKEYSFTHYTTTTGLVSNQVNSVLQDDEGYIWIGSTDGLQRFDGTRYKTFRHNSMDSTTLPYNPIEQIMADKGKNLWVLFYNGTVGVFDTKKFTFRKVPVKPKNPNSINAASKEIIKDEYGNFFLLFQSSEVITWSEKTKDFSYTNNFFKQKEEWHIADFIPQPGTHKYWMSMQEGIVAIYNAATGNLSYTGNNVEKESFLEEFKINSPSFHFYFDSKHRVWFINWNPAVPMIYCYDLNANKRIAENFEFYSTLKSYHEIYGFFEQKDGTFWVRGGPVFARFLENEKKFQMVYNGYRNEQGITYNAISALCEDREKNIWVGTNTNGLFRFNPETEFFTNVKHINHSNLKTGDGTPMSFITTKWGTVLAGTWGDGMYAYDSKDFSTVPFGIKDFGTKINPYAWCMVASADSNHIWISSQPGIYVIDQDKRSFKFFNPPIFENRTIRQIAEDKNGNLWLGTQSRGLYKWTKSKGAQKFDDGISKFTAISNGLVGKITVDSKGYVWAACGLDGVYVIDANTDKIVMHFSDTATGGRKLPEQVVSAIMEYDDTTMLITTSTNIIRYNRVSKRSALIGRPEFISGYISSLEKDKNGFVWMTTTNGLYRINIQKGIFVNFNRADGIENECFIQASSYVMPDGRMIFGSSNHFIVFDPSRIQIRPVFPWVTVTDFKVMNKSLPLDSLLALKKIELGYDQNSLVIEFSPLLYNNASLIKYKLEGLDKEWIISDKNNQAVYNYLPPGSYTFLIKSMNEDGVESNKITRLVIVVNAPFWKTWWFYSVLTLLVMGLLFWLDRLRTKRTAAIQKMRTDIADKLHQEVNTALNNINILSEMAKLKADKDIEKSKEYIQQIHGKSQQMIVAMDDMLWGISPDNDSMQKTIERIREHIDALRNRYGVAIDLLVDEKVTTLNLNMELRQNVFWLLRGGSTNIVRTGAADCRFYIGFKKPNLTYTLDFDSSNTDMLQLNNLLQRQELADKLKEVNAVLNVQLQKTRSIIELAIPVQ
ncbi:ligand-binding sensor domain-containing protein [Ferruginibacter profundus]